MVEFAVIAAPLSKALGLSLVVERILEVGKNVLESLLGPKTVRALPPPDQAAQAVEALDAAVAEDRQAAEVESDAEGEAEERVAKSERLQELRATLRAAEASGAASAEDRATLRREIVALTAALRERERQGEWDERVGPSMVLSTPANDPDDGKVVKTLVLQLVGFAAGIVLARAAGVALFGTFLGADAGLPVSLDYVMTGLLIGGGSGPMHVLVRFITERKTLTAEPPGAEAGPAGGAGVEAPIAPEAPAVIAARASEDLADWVDIPYHGGVDRETLEHVHKRAADPTLIVFHHTAMDSRSTFDDVVRVITNRTSGGGRWLTGYNCVILADGSVHPFCRWDRYGNHAVGFNRQSLGIAFNGNFESDPHVPFSNPDGRMGALRPTEDQLRSGARVVALWTFLYDIPVDFAAGIIPHKQIASKACPGSQFPYGEFQRWVEHYRSKWETSAVVQDRLAAFKLKPYLYVGGTPS